MQIILGNKLYSSWSMRPWLILKVFAIPFDEVVIPLDMPDTKANREAYAPSPTVPILIDGEIKVWETLAIIEYLAEKFPDLAIWPRDVRARVQARVISSEMHAGFGALRSACPMNFGRRFAHRDRGDGVTKDVARIEKLLCETRAAFGQAGAFLFGDFSAADAMYAPVAARLWGYSFALSPTLQAYVDDVLAHPAVMEWREAGLKEPWTIAHDEVDEPAIEELRSL